MVQNILWFPAALLFLPWMFFLVQFVLVLVLDFLVGGFLFLLWSAFPAGDSSLQALPLSTTMLTVVNTVVHALLPSTCKYQQAQCEWFIATYFIWQRGKNNKGSFCRAAARLKMSCMKSEGIFFFCQETQFSYEWAVWKKHRTSKRGDNYGHFLFCWMETILWGRTMTYRDS